MVKTKVLITGGAGFIGSNFARLLLEERPDWEIVVLDKLTYAGRVENLGEARDDARLQFIQGDICDAAAVEAAMDGCNFVFNFAAESHVDRSLLGEDAGSFVQTDVFGVYVLLETARRIGVERFVQISTDEVYGDVEEGFSREDDALLPRSPYAASKAGGELLARSYFVSHDVPVVITRGSNTFGPFQYPEKLMPLFIANAIDDKELPLYGDGLQRRDWLWVKDHCKGVLLAAEKGAPGEAYNIGGGNERTNVEVTKLILEALDKPQTLIKRVSDRPGHDRRYALNCEKLQSLGWSASPDFESNVEKTVAWYRDNESWWRFIMSGSEYVKYYKRNYANR